MRRQRNETPLAQQQQQKQQLAAFVAAETKMLKGTLMNLDQTEVQLIAEIKKLEHAEKKLLREKELLLQKMN